MFHIVGVLGVKLLSDGSMARLESNIRYNLNTPEGVIRFVTEMNPFLSITVKQDQVDVTEKFRKYIIYSKSRAEVK